LTWAVAAAVALQIEELEQEPRALKERSEKARHHHVNEAYCRVSLVWMGDGLERYGRG
jgi:hypothetical protein